MSDIVQELYDLMKDCTLCPQECRVNRIEGEKGICEQSDKPRIASAFPHFGEETPLVGHNGSGTIFLSGCNLKCLYCQNYEISHLNEGSQTTVDELAKIMLSLQSQGALNINLVSPTHQTPQIVDAVMLAKERGLIVPIVYNCGGYEALPTLKLLEGIVDIYMPDVKYFNDDHALNFSQAQGYTEVIKNALKEMHRQVGDLDLNKRGIAKKGLLIRHLVLPNDLATSKKALDFIAKEISVNTYVNVMDQYHPAYQAHEYELLKYPLYFHDYKEIVNHAVKLGLTRGLEKAVYRKRAFFNF